MKKSSAAGDSLLRTVLRMVCWIVLIISALLATYMAAALAGSLMPANMGWVEPGQGVRIFVYSNGVHTGIVVPTANQVKDWRSLVQIGRASCRERVCQYVYIWVVAVSLKKKKQ